MYLKTEFAELSKMLFLCAKHDLKNVASQSTHKALFARDHTGGSGPEAANAGSRIPSAWPPREFPGDRKVRCKTLKGGNRVC